jgi:spore coat polysaccharide biosynthesis protein SpsF
MMDKDCSTRRVIAVLQVDPSSGVSAAERLLQGLRQSRLVDGIALALGADARNDSIAEYGRANGLAVIRCPGDDFLSGFARAAELLDADIVVRIGSDAAVNGALLDHLVRQLIEQECDHILPAGRDAAQVAGIEPFTRHALDKLLLDVADDPAARQRVTLYFALHPDFVTTAHAAPFAGTPSSDDRTFVDAVHERLGANDGQATLADLLALAEREDSSARRSRVAQGATALIRVESRGLGRAKRMIMLARALRDRESINPVFSVGGSEELPALIKEAGFEVRRTSAILPKGKPAPDLLVVDCAGDADIESVDAGVTCVIADCSSNRLAADYAYYAPLPQVLELDWAGSHTIVRTGWEWALPGLVPSPNRPRGRSPRPTVLVSMGAGDPHDLTLCVAKALAQLDPVFRARFVIGPGFKAHQRLAKTIVELRSNFETIEGACGLGTEFAACDLAISGAAVTACELAAFGVPALYLCADADEARTASAFEHAGMGLCLGVAGARDACNPAAVWSLLNNSQKRREMGMAGPMIVDGMAAARIASELAAAVAAGRDSKRVVS